MQRKRRHGAVVMRSGITQSSLLAMLFLLAMRCWIINISTSMVWLVESIRTASSAQVSGAVSRLESSASRRSIWQASAGSRPRLTDASASALMALHDAATGALARIGGQKYLVSTSGKTTVPISRPSATTSRPWRNGAGERGEWPKPPKWQPLRRRCGPPRGCRMTSETSTPIHEDGDVAVISAPNVMWMSRAS